MEVIDVPGIPRPEGAAAVFRLADPSRELSAVRLRQDLKLPEDRLGFHRRGDHWELVLPPLPVSRLEYLLELVHADGHRETVPDPGNPHRVNGGFGPRSVLEFAGYQPPAWLDAPLAPGRREILDLPAPMLDDEIPARIWAPADAPDDERLPLLLVHDGPEYDRQGLITRYLAAGLAGRWLPRVRAALLSPGSRHRWYSANASYARAVRLAVIPALTRRLATSARIGVGASLGALALLHAQVQYPDAFDALFLQSGSFFVPRYDDQERDFPYYRRIVRFVAGASTGRLPSRRIPVVLTCGEPEENVHNNRSMAKALRARGYPAELHEVPDMHNFTNWRDALDPYLTRLLGGGDGQ